MARCDGQLDRTRTRLICRPVVTDAKTNVATILDRTVCRALAKMGFAVRVEEFTRSDPSRQQSVLADETIRVLVHMFRADNYEHREVNAMAKALQLEENVLRYHLDRLQEAKLTETTGFNYVQGAAYWDLTPDGRRYVIEHMCPSR
jgi:hypothetical protein